MRFSAPEEIGEKETQCKEWNCEIEVVMKGFIGLGRLARRKKQKTVISDV